MYNRTLDIVSVGTYEGEGVHGGTKIKTGIQFGFHWLSCGGGGADGVGGRARFRIELGKISQWEILRDEMIKEGL